MRDNRAQLVRKPHTMLDQGQLETQNEKTVFVLLVKGVVKIPPSVRGRVGR